MVAEPLGETLRCFRRKTFKVVADKGPDVADFGKMSLDLKRPTFNGGFAFPKEFIVTVNEFTGPVVLCRIVAEQS